MVQEAVTRLFELSGKTKEMANGKYSENYPELLDRSQCHACFPENLGAPEQVVRGGWRMLADPIREGKRLYSPDFGWMYV